MCVFWKFDRVTCDLGVIVGEMINEWRLQLENITEKRQLKMMMYSAVG